MLQLRMDTTEVTPGAADTALLTAIGGACVSCGAALHADQRYCLECGIRNGRPRLAFMDGRTAPQAEPPFVAPAPAAAERTTASGVTLIAGVATLLLAMGVGVLIGAAGNKAPAPAASSRVQVVSVPAAAPAGAATPAPATATTPATTSTAHGAAAKKAAKTAAPGSVKKAPAPKAVKVGSKGHGPGYKKGKFTGDFFGP